MFFFFSGCMFFLGVLVGRGTVPVNFFDSEDLQLELAALKKAAVEDEIEKIKIESSELNNKHDLGFYEELKKNRLQTSISRYPEKKREKAPVKTKKKGLGQKAEIFQPVWKPKIVKNEEYQRKTETFQPVQKPENSNAKKTGTRKKITIQVASFRNPQDADRMVKRLTARGYPAYKSTGDVSGEGTWHRVRIGSFNKRIEARSTMDRLKRDNLIAILVNEK